MAKQRKHVFSSTPIAEVRINDHESVKVYDTFDIDGDFIRIGPISNLLEQQSQYLSHYMDGIGGAPNLGSGLRIKRPDPGSYHEYEIHKDDVAKFVERVREYKKRFE